MSKNNRTKPTRYKKTNNKEKKSYIREEILSIIVLMIAVFVYVGLRNYQGIPDSDQFIGLIGIQLMRLIDISFGLASILVPLFLLIWSIHIGVIKKLWSVRMWGVAILAIAILISISIYNTPKGITSLDAGIKGLGGGYIGGFISYSLVTLVGNIGAVIAIILSCILAIIMIIEKPISEIIKFLINIVKKTRNYFVDIMYYKPEESESKKDVKNLSEEPSTIDSTNTEPVIINHLDTDNNLPHILESNNTDYVKADKTDKSDKTDKKPVKRQKNKSKSEPIDISFNKTDNDLDFIYKKPPLELLTNINNEKSVDKKNIKQSISVLEDTFSSFGIKVKVNQVSCGPAITRYELTPAPGVKVSKILSLTDDLQLNLAAPGIRMEAPIPGKSAVGIEVPNSLMASVGLKNLLTSSLFKNLNSPLAFALGEDIGGNPVVAKLKDMPHLLIAGSTGSGKSVCLNCIITSFLYNSSPDELKLVFIDPKMVELTVFNGIPHLMTPVVTDPKKASVVLRWMVTEMEKRYRIFAEKGVRDINRYNELSEDFMPYIVIIIDELADLMLVSPVEVEDSICRLAQMARAAGIHLIVATQRPSVDVVTGLIKANIPSRIAFAVSSQADSRTILDMGGAEKLLGKGDMLFFPIGAVKPFRIQGAFVSDNDIENTVNYIKSQVVVEEKAELTNELESTLEKSDTDIGDELYWDAVKIFVDNGKASVSLLQRKLRIGYSRAARLVDMMEERGIVSELDSNKKREVLIDNQQFENLYSN
ncbi:DNA translocase FtsK [Candidatus Syntrophocurvum alkaliphilum]|uniref:DNA translocase FtsK n=1 Tax=Candidatus Syntrophocurvum alkaliphilum TaxID=2293317 RepID=A0A6I6DBH2_9FIRM|nr:DNA translocase FtsK [Candidatus Syntrophocurvum alkaliphilum]QGT99649.1 DNA translocase FtsK [Candidatus Syntrophocurvum alkaliphilum]